MSKIDKILYSGFAVVAIGSLIALLVSVFSPPKQVVEKTVEPPPMETASEPSPPEMDMRSYWLDDHGNKTYITDEELAASDAIEAEFKRQEEEQKALDEAEKAWWESRQDWVERFPFEPTHDPEIVYDTTMYDSGKVFRGEWPEEKKDKAYWKMKQRVENHGFLRHFYDSYLPYTEEFEQMCNIIKEEFREVGNPIPLGWTFNALKEYHQASQREPDEVYRENVHAEIPSEPTAPTSKPAFEPIPLPAGFSNLPEEEQQVYLAALVEAHREKFEAAIPSPIEPQYEVRDVTWADRTERLETLIIGPLVNTEIGWEGIPKEQAIAIRDRLINEIPAAGFLEMGEDGFAYIEKYELELKPGDPLLIK